MKRTMLKRLVCAIAASVLVGPIASLAPVAKAAVADDGMPSQANLDKVAAANDYAGFWGDAPGGVAGRPYVKTLNVINGGVSTPVVTAGTATTPDPTSPGAITTVISPTNLCKTGQSGQNCYPSPNRLGISLVYVKGPGQVGFNFSKPTTSNGADLALPVAVNADTVVEMVVNMNTWGTNLRWTWMNASPQFWKIDNIGTAAAEITLRFKMVTGPSQLCQTRIPVEACDPAEAVRNNGGRPFNPEKVLTFSSVLSLDATGVSAEFNGALFASSNADIGSLVTETGPNGGPVLNYGIVGPSELGGAPNLATFNAFVSDASLLSYFGVTPDVVTTDAFRDSALAISRADGGSSGASTWTRWDAATYGSDGWYLSIGDIAFNGTSVSSQGVSSSAQTVAQPARVTVKQKVASKLIRKKAGTAALVTLRATATACAKSSCRIVVQKINDPLTASAKKLRTIAVKGKLKSVSLQVKVGGAAKQSLAVVLQTKKAGKWVYVSSGVSKP